MKQYDFSHPSFFRHQPRRRELLKRLYKSGATEDEFVKANREIVKLNGSVRQRNAPSASEAKVMKWGNERETHA